MGQPDPNPPSAGDGTRRSLGRLPLSSCVLLAVLSLTGCTLGLDTSLTARPPDDAVEADRGIDLDTGTEPDAADLGDAGLDDGDGDGSSVDASVDDGPTDIADAPQADVDDDLTDGGGEDLLDVDGPDDAGLVDTDGDFIPDAVEGCDVDSDGDRVPNCEDLDSDDDGILDATEAGDSDVATRPVDTDGDEVPDYLDDDSDDDHVPDADEAGDDDLDTPPADSDDDGVYDFRDTDSDDDGLFDGSETGCFLSTSRLDPDSDDDGSSDLVEVALGSDPCTAASDPYQLVDAVVVVSTGSVQTIELELVASPRRVDILFNMDATGSMEEELNDLDANLSTTVIDRLETDFPESDFGYGVSAYRDFPMAPFGSPGDYPFRLLQRISTIGAQSEAALGLLSTGGGNDQPESGWEALYQIATGAGGVTWSGGSIDPFDSSDGFELGVADGTRGGAGFRDGALPLVVHVTDAANHAAGDYEEDVTGAHSSGDALGALESELGARVLGLVSIGNATARAEVVDIATATHTVVPTCAFAGGCTDDKCCTASGGTARDPGAEGCPLVFDVQANGSDLSDTAAVAVATMLQFTAFEMTTRLVPDAEELASTGLDTTCFATPPEAVDFTPPSCLGDAIQLLDRADPVGQPDSFSNVPPDTGLKFEVGFENAGCVEEDHATPRAFRVVIELVSDGGALFGSALVAVVVPPAPS